MRLSSTIRIALALAAVAMVAPSGVAQGQYVPYGRYGYGGWGGWPQPSAAVVPRDAMAAQKGADRRQQLSMNAAQFQARNDVVRVEAQHRAAQMGQSQAASDAAWTQEVLRQAGQTAARQQSYATARLPVDSPLLPPLPTLPPSKPAASRPAAAAPTVPAAGGTRWPSLLNDARFAVPRAKLEELLGSSGSVKAGLTTPEYEEIIKQAEDMKDVLRGMAPELNAAEYLAVQRFLDDLIAKAKAAASPNQ